jgi:flagellar FliJ protein
VKKFNFRLQRVTEVRQRVEKERQRELALSQGKLKSEELRLQEISEDAERSHAGLRQALGQQKNAGHLLALDCWLSRQLQELEAQAERTREQQDAVEQDRGALIQASKERKVLDKLKERRRAEHRAKVQRAEQIFLDEIGQRESESLDSFQTHLVLTETEKEIA